MTSSTNGYVETSKWFEVEYYSLANPEKKRTGYTTSKEQASLISENMKSGRFVWNLHSYNTTKGSDDTREATQRLDGGWVNIGDDWITVGRKY